VAAAEQTAAQARLQLRAALAGQRSDVGATGAGALEKRCPAVAERLGSFLSYMVASHVRAGRLRYVLEDFEVEPMPVSFVSPQARMLSPTVRAFADLCAERLRRMRFD